jgi:hypothetical protein
MIAKVWVTSIRILKSNSVENDLIRSSTSTSGKLNMEPIVGKWSKSKTDDMPKTLLPVADEHA